jgi:anti-sigma factor RsiW
MDIQEPFHESGIDLSAYVDDELGHAERLRVAAHLETCARCREEVERFRRLTVLLRAADEEESADLGEISLWPAIERQIGNGAGAPRSIVERWRRWAPAWARPVWVPLAAAVVLALVLVVPLVHHTATSQADEAIVESVDQGEVMVLKGGKKSTIIWVFGK